MRRCWVLCVVASVLLHESSTEERPLRAVELRPAQGAAVCIPGHLGGFAWCSCDSVCFGLSLPPKGLDGVQTPALQAHQDRLPAFHASAAMANPF